MNYFHTVMAALAGLPGVTSSMANTAYTQRLEDRRKEQAEALAKKQAVREQIRARRAAKETK